MKMKISSNAVELPDASDRCFRSPWDLLARICKQVATRNGWKLMAKLNSFEMETLTLISNELNRIRSKITMEIEIVSLLVLLRLSVLAHTDSQVLLVCIAEDSLLAKQINESSLPSKKRKLDIPQLNYVSYVKETHVDFRRLFDVAAPALEILQQKSKIFTELDVMKFGIVDQFCADSLLFNGEFNEFVDRFNGSSNTAMKSIQLASCFYQRQDFLTACRIALRCCCRDQLVFLSFFSVSFITLLPSART